MLMLYIMEYSDLQCLHACQAVECSIFKSLDLVIVQWSKKKIRRQSCNHKRHLHKVKTDSQYIVKLSIITIDWLLSDREMYLGVCIGSCLSWEAAAALMLVHGRPELASWIFGCHKEL